jgi:predicted ATPase
MDDEKVDFKLQSMAQDLAYGYPEEEKGKNWLEMIIEYLKSSKQAKEPQLKKTV